MWCIYVQTAMLTIWAAVLIIVVIVVDMLLKVLKGFKEWQLDVYVITPKEHKVIEIGIETSGNLDYITKCPECNKTFSPKFGVSVCPHCSTRTPHPSDMYWLPRSRKYYYSFWSAFYDN